LVFTPLPYIAVYRVTPTHIEISRIWHGRSGANNRSGMSLCHPIACCR